MISRRWWDTPCEGIFIDAVLDTYISLPHTPNSSENIDRRYARDLYREGYQLYKLEAALLLGTLRRIFSNPDSFQPKVKSLVGFTSYIEELRYEDLDIDYVRYLRHLLSPVLRLDKENPRQ